MSSLALSPCKLYMTKVGWRIKRVELDESDESDESEERKGKGEEGSCSSTQ